MSTATQTEPASGTTGTAPVPVTISVQNLSTTATDAEVQQYVEALHIQMTRDYGGSDWITEREGTPVGAVTFVPRGQPVPADTWHMEVLDTSDQPGALGYHEDGVFDAHAPVGPRKASERSSRGLRADAPEQPLMKVFAKTCMEDGASLSECMSHELLEAAVDPQVVHSLRTITDSVTKRLYPVEVGDPVQESSYLIAVAGGVMVQVANFVTPAYFRLPQTSNPTQYDFRSVLPSPVPAMTPGGYLSFAPEGEPENWQQEFGSGGGA